MAQPRAAKRRPTHPTGPKLSPHGSGSLSSPHGLSFSRSRTLQNPFALTISSRSSATPISRIGTTSSPVSSPLLSLHHRISYCLQHRLLLSSSLLALPRFDRHLWGLNPAASTSPISSSTCSTEFSSSTFCAASASPSSRRPPLSLGSASPSTPRPLRGSLPSLPALPVLSPAQPARNTSLSRRPKPPRPGRSIRHRNSGSALT